MSFKNGEGARGFGAADSGIRVYGGGGWGGFYARGGGEFVVI